MKNYIILSIMLWAFVASGQTKTTYPVLYPKQAVNVKMDTVKCIMLYTDISVFTTHPNSNIAMPPTVTSGYAVNKSNSIFVEYLDKNKQPLLKSIIVWMSKDL